MPPLPRAGGADPITTLVNRLSRLPGIGERTAQRLAFHLLRAPAEEAEALSQAILDVRTRVRLCERCCNFTEASPCPTCLNPRRDPSILCVVESPQDVQAIEVTGEFQGLYHVLHGVIAPLEGVGPEALKFKELLDRIGQQPVQEVIAAMNPSVEGEATALYLKRLLAPLGVAVSRIASGLPMGSHLEYADKVTIGRSIAGRRPL
jgi:recombination protein RecR